MAEGKAGLPWSGNEWEERYAAFAAEHFFFFNQ